MFSNAEELDEHMDERTPLGLAALPTKDLGREEFLANESQMGTDDQGFQVLCSLFWFTFRVNADLPIFIRVRLHPSVIFHSLTAEFRGKNLKPFPRIETSPLPAPERLENLH